MEEGARRRSGEQQLLCLCWVSPGLATSLATLFREVSQGWIPSHGHKHPVLAPTMVEVCAGDGL